MTRLGQSSHHTTDRERECYIMAYSKITYISRKRCDCGNKWEVDKEKCGEILKHSTIEQNAMYIFVMANTSWKFTQEWIIYNYITNLCDNGYKF